jgi:hypothetical protein
MEGHHLILGKTVDFLTGETLDDTLDERYRQEIARLLVEEKGFDRKEIQSRFELQVKAGEKRAAVKIDFLIRIGARIVMLVRFGPGSLVTRQRSTLAAARLAAPYQIPIAVITNGEDADILDGAGGKVLAQGLAAIPSKAQLQRQMPDFAFEPVSEVQKERESRVFYVFEVDGTCPCDNTICRLE